MKRREFPQFPSMVQMYRQNLPAVLDKLSFHNDLERLLQTQFAQPDFNDKASDSQRLAWPLTPQTATSPARKPTIGILACPGAALSFEFPKDCRVEDCVEIFGDRSFAAR